nr:hypothetical protein Q903MT_gene34 [Picea sitchensis]
MRRVNKSIKLCRGESINQEKSTSIGCNVNKHRSINESTTSLPRSVHPEWVHSVPPACLAPSCPETADLPLASKHKGAEPQSKRFHPENNIESL